MIFGNPTALWLFFMVILILLLGFWGWRAKKEIIWVKLDKNFAKRNLIRKYALAGLMVSILILAFALPRLPALLPGGSGKAGFIAPMVDVSGSMAAKTDLDSPSRLERAKFILNELIDRFPEAEFYPFRFTDKSRSITPPLSKEDFPYLKRSISRVLDVYSAPGRGSSFWEPISGVINKIPKEKKAKIILLFSDGEIYDHQKRKIDSERSLLDTATRRAVQSDIKIITVGVGEKEGATIPIYDEEGEFTGEYAKEKDKVFVTYLEEETLKIIASGTNGKYFFEDDVKGIIGFLESNLVSVDQEERKGYQEAGHYFLFLFALFWAIFAKYYFK